MYADYQYYSDNLKLSKLKEQEYYEYAEKASAYIDYITLGRAISYKDNDNVKKCCCYIAEIFKRYKAGKVISSEKSGNWSASYNNTSKASELSECVKIYLAPLGLLYRGIG